MDWLGGYLIDESREEQWQEMGRNIKDDGWQEEWKYSKK